MKSIGKTNIKEVEKMTNSQSSKMEVPQAKEAMDKFKMEVASELGVPLKNGGYLAGHTTGSC